MTQASLELNVFAEKHLDDDLLRQLGPFVLQRLIEADVEAKVGAALGERTEDRTTHRNGYRDRSLQTRISELNLKIPKLLGGQLLPVFPRTASMLRTCISGRYSGSIYPRRQHSKGR